VAGVSSVRPDTWHFLVAWACGRVVPGPGPAGFGREWSQRQGGVASGQCLVAKTKIKIQPRISDQATGLAAVH